MLVIGGGSTGAGVVRDAAMRGFKTVLVERRDLADGTTGRYHGLLHSGGRYAVKDPLAAEECVAENTILRRIASDLRRETAVAKSGSGEPPFEPADQTPAEQDAGLPPR